MNKWRIGEVTITKITDHESVGGAEFLMPEMVPANLSKIGWLKPYFVDQDWLMRMSCNAFVVETSRRRILVDTCLGNDKQGRMAPTMDNRQAPFLDDLKQAGYPRESIDMVLCTHLHVGHVGFNTTWLDGRWVPTFPNAQYLVGGTELEYWRNNRTDPFHAVVFDDSVQPVLDAGVMSAVASDYRLCDEVILISMPGHTAGHVSVGISSGGEEALLAGDLLHHPAQCAYPQWGTVLDFDREQATRTRHEMLARLAGTQTLVLGAHFISPTAGHIVSDGDAYRFVV